jgi:hypothetical protein
LKLNSAHSRNQQQFQARLQLQKDLRRKDPERVGDLLVGSQRFANSLFKSEAPTRVFHSVDELVLAGNQTFETLDNVDFASFRNDKEVGQKVVAEARAELAKFHPEGPGEAFNQDLRRVLHARYLQGHGIQVREHLDGDELARLRRYVQRQESTNNVADAARAINAALAAGQENPQQLLLEAERALFGERGLEPASFDSKFAGLSLEALGQIRDFSDSWAVSQSGKYLGQAEGKTPDQLRDSITRSLLRDQGYTQVEALDAATALSLLRDCSAEGPRTNASMAEAINAGVAAGETNYFALTTLGNQKILGELGLSPNAQKSLHVRDKELQAAYPDLDAVEARAIRTRVLRDLLRVLPDGERQAAMAHLRESQADLITAEETLKKYFGERIRDYSGYSTHYGPMDAMQRANLTSALSRLPQEVRQKAFVGPDKSTRDRLEQLIESTFQVEVHRTPGQAPNGNEKYVPFVQDFTVQGMLDLYNALSSMSKNGQLPPGLAGTTTLSYMVGAPRPDSMTPVNLYQPESTAVEPWNRPGAWAYTQGQSGFFGECAPNDKGHDQVVLYDDALLGGNGDSAVGLTLGEATLIHELGHAIQLGGTPNAPEATRQQEDQLRMAEWSSLSRWTEPGQLLADGRMGDFEYYYDPTVQVENRQQVATAYGASDPCEDFAEYTPFFFKDPDTALGLSAEKFLYYNQLVNHHYSPDQVAQMAAARGISAEQLQAVEQQMKAKISAAPQQAGLLAA